MFRSQCVGYYANIVRSITCLVHPYPAVGFVQHPSDTHAHEIWTNSRPRLVVDFLVAGERLLDTAIFENNNINSKTYFIRN